jgi:hypothetical protein
MLPLYAAWIEDLRPGDLVKVDCSACQHVALLTPGALIGRRSELGPPGVWTYLERAIQLP